MRTNQQFGSIKILLSLLVIGLIVCVTQVNACDATPKTRKPCDPLLEMVVGGQTVQVHPKLIPLAVVWGSRPRQAQFIVELGECKVFIPANNETQLVMTMSAAKIDMYTPWIHLESLGRFGWKDKITQYIPDFLFPDMKFEDLMSNVGGIHAQSLLISLQAISSNSDFSTSGACNAIFKSPPTAIRLASWNWNNTVDGFVPGMASAYIPIHKGTILECVFPFVDLPKRRNMTTYFQQEILPMVEGSEGPNSIKIDYYVGLPASDTVNNARVVTRVKDSVTYPDINTDNAEFTAQLKITGTAVNMGTLNPPQLVTEASDVNNPLLRGRKIWAGEVYTNVLSAHYLARFYAMGGRINSTHKLFPASAITRATKTKICGRDFYLKSYLCMLIGGFQGPNTASNYTFGPAGSFGHDGKGGSFRFIRPDIEMTFTYLTPIVYNTRPNHQLPDSTQELVDVINRIFPF